MALHVLGKGAKGDHAVRQGYVATGRRRER